MDATITGLPFKLGMLLHKLHEAGCGPIRSQGGEYRCRCPAHDDNGPSLYVRLAGDKILLHCSAGCTAREVCDRLDHDLSDLTIDADDVWDDDQHLDIAREAGDSAGPPREPGGDTAAAVADLRNGVYADLLSGLELSATHFENLIQRGLTVDEITRRGYRTTDAGKLSTAVDNLLNRYGREKLLKVPGFTDRNGRVVFRPSQGCLIPVRDLAGQVVALKVRHDDGHSASKYTWASSSEASCGSPVHVPLGVPVPSATVRLTEGELKADVAFVLSGLPTVSAPGVTNWHLAVPALKAVGASRVVLAFDQDGKPGTLAAVEKALYGLTRAGFEVSAEWWDGVQAKGIDDLLAAGLRPELIPAMVAAVRARDGLTGPEADAAAGPEDEPEPAPWPAGVFPPALETFLAEAAEATSSPPDFAGLTMLVTAGAAVGNSRAVCLRENVWLEAPRFYAANVGDPASGKTPAMEAVLAPYQTLQLRQLSQWRAARDAYDRAREEYEQAVKENRALPEDQRQPLPPVPEEPKGPERFIVVEATKESLAPLLEQNPRGLLMPQDEGTGWVHGMDMYRGGRGNDRQFWLSAWSGKSYIVDRKAQGVVPVSIPRPFLNVVCGLPPDLLNEFADRRNRRDGFLDRVLFVMPRALAGTEWTETTVSAASREAWKNTLTCLRQLTMQETEDGVAGYRVVNLSPAAKAAWVAWYNAHGAEIRSPDLPAQLIGPWGKLKSYAARIALVLHCVWLVQGHEDEGDLDAACLERALRLVDYFKSHLRAVYARLRRPPEENQLLEAVDWVRRGGGRCTARQLARARQVANTDRAKKLLKELTERGYGRLEWLEAKNGRKVEWFVFDPS